MFGERRERLRRGIAQVQSEREPPGQGRLLESTSGGDMRQFAHGRVSSRAWRRHKHDRQRDALGDALECGVWSRGHSRLLVDTQCRSRDG